MDDFGSAIAGLAQQVVKITAGIAGMAAITSGATQAFQAVTGVVRAASGIIGVAFKGLADVVNTIKAGFKGVQSALTAMADGIGSFIGGTLRVFVDIIGATVKAFTSLVDATTKLVTGLITLGAAAAPGGLQLFSKTMTYLTTVLGSVATPIFSAFSAVVLSIADYLKGPFLAATKVVSDWFQNNLKGAISDTIKSFVTFIQNVDLYGTKFVNVIDTVIVALLDFKDRFMIVIDNLSAYMKIALSGISDAIGFLLRFIPGTGDRHKQYASDAEKGRESAKQDIQSAEDRRWAIINRDQDAKKRQDERTKSSQDRRNALEGSKAPGGSIDAGVAAVLSNVGGNLKAAIAEMRNSLAKNANVGFSGIADVAKNIQMQAFQSSIDQRQLDTQIKILNVLEAMANKGLNPQAGPQAVLAP